MNKRFLSCWGLFLVMFVSGLFSSAARGEEFRYRLVDEKGIMDWHVVSPKPLVGKSIPPNQQAKDGVESFQTLVINKKQISFADYFRKHKAFKSLNSIAVLGDTGCRLKESKDKNQSDYQDCSDPSQWPYPQLIEKLAHHKPDLVIHVGDFHYREHCSPGRPCQSMSSAIGYGWEPWRLDFFAPSKAGFDAAPWLVTRGNHEDCKRAYLGYRLLLRTSDWAEECDDFEESQVVEIGNLAIINLDSSSVPDLPDAKEESDVLWKKRMDRIGEKLKNVKADHIWLVTHKPIYGLVPLGKNFAPLNINLRKYFEAASWGKKVELLLAGHIHNSQINRVEGFPVQVVIGTGGTSLDKSSGKVSEENIKQVGYEKAKLVIHNFGYLLIKNLQEKTVKSKLLLEFHEASGEVAFSCHLSDRANDCF